MNIELMRARLAEIDGEYRAIHETAGENALDADQQTRWDALDTEKADLERKIHDAEEQAQRSERIAASRAKWGSVQVKATAQDDTFDLTEVRGLTNDALVDRAMSSIEKAKYGRVAIPDEARAEALRKIETVDGVALHALAHGSKAYMSAFRSWLSQGGSPVYTAEEAAAVRAAMSLTSGNGGYMLPTLLDPTLIKTGALTKNPIRRISRVVTGTQKTWNGVTVGNVTTAWKAEGSAFTEGSPTFGGIDVTAEMLTAYLTASYELFQDSDAQAQLPGLIAEAIDMEEGVQFIQGTGSGKPIGVIGSVSGTAGSLVTVTTRGTYSSASAVDTIALFNAVPSRYEDSATFVANKATVTSVQQQTIGTAGTLLTEMVAAGTLLGSPIVRASSVTAATTSGNIVAVLGDFSQFIVYDRIGISLEFIANVVGIDGIPTGQRGLVAYKRVGSDVSDVNAFRLLKA